MPSKNDIEEIIKWCEQKKAEEKRFVAVEKNPFRDKMAWTFRYPLIEIDRPTEVAHESSLVYDSTTKTVWHFLNGNWRKVEPDFVVK
ncbi:MAG: hypothetical protein NTY68_03560 [Candidatus Micrarchaeota archaeon]|nr:hypothetical protein [Candidatus Micrarchaeota archaeon]